MGDDLDGDNGFSSLNGSINDSVKLAEQNRRHLAIVDRSALRRDCLRLALGQQPRRWRVTDVESTADLVRLLRQGAGFSVILLGAATCHTIDLVDLSLLAAVSAKTPILVTADCDDTESASRDPSLRRPRLPADQPRPQGFDGRARAHARRRHLCASGY